MSFMCMCKYTSVYDVEASVNTPVYLGHPYLRQFTILFPPLRFAWLEFFGTTCLGKWFSIRICRGNLSLSVCKISEENLQGKETKLLET